MPRHILILLFIVATLLQKVSATQVDDDDFWLLLDYQEPLQNALWLYGGLDELDGSYYGGSADLALLDALHFNFTLTEQNYEVETIDLRWGFSGAINRNFSWSVLKKFWGKKEALEKNDLAFSLSYFYRRFNLRGAYETGDVELFLRDIPIIRRDSVSTDHRAWEISAGYSWPVFYTQLSYKAHDYDRDLSVIARRPRLFLSFDTVGIQQAGALADYEASILLGARAGSMVYELYLTRIKSAVFEDLNTYATVHLARSLSRSFELGLDFELPVNNVPFSAGLTLGIMW
ncbi:MAG TPA: hypothetical protein ENJ11_10080 [Gammaproteobacteria bacterium]|nr:hypothetical protein [Gammaproteobacteria bacterium]